MSADTFDNHLDAELRLLDEAAAYQTSPNATAPAGNPYLTATPTWIAERAAAYQSLRARAGIAPQPAAPTPEERARNEINESFAHMEIGENLAGMIEADLARIAGLSPDERNEMIAALKSEHGEEGYFRLVNAARVGLAGQTLTDAMQASKHFLNVAAVKGRAIAARDRALGAINRS